MLLHFLFFPGQSNDWSLREPGKWKENEHAATPSIFVSIFFFSGQAILIYIKEVNDEAWPVKKEKRKIDGRSPSFFSFPGSIPWPFIDPGLKEK